jgi:hypothetical protein
VSRATVRKVIRGPATEFKYERGVQPAPKLGECVEVLTGILRRKQSCPGGNAARPSAYSKSCVVAVTMARTTACIASSRPGGTNAPEFRSMPVYR